MKNGSTTLTIFFCFLVSVFNFSCSKKGTDPWDSAGLHSRGTPNLPTCTSCPAYAHGGSITGPGPQQDLRDDVIIFHGESGTIAFSTLVENQEPEKAIIDITIPPDRPNPCTGEGGVYEVYIKLSQPLDPNPSIAAVLSPGSGVDSVKIDLISSPFPDSLIVRCFSSSNLMASNLSQVPIQIRIYLHNQSGVPLPDPQQIIRSLYAACAGIEVVILPTIQMGQGRYTNRSSLFILKTVAAEAPSSTAMNLARRMLESLWEENRIPAQLTSVNSRNRLMFDYYNVTIASDPGASWE